MSSFLMLLVFLGFPTYENYPVENIGIDSSMHQLCWLYSSAVLMDESVLEQKN